MTLPVERSRSRRPVTWLTLIGVLLLPAVIGGILVGALYNPTDRLENITAAIVNDDKAVELNGQLVPLGRQLTGGLVKGADDQSSNIDWVISNDEDAAAGLADGTYTAVVTIPENFTAASLSTRPGETPVKATIGVQTAPDARVVDGAITSALATTATSVYGGELSSQYLKNVFLGFTTLSDQLGSAASGAHQLADGASQAATGAGDLRDGLGQLSTGAAGVADGAAQIAAGTGPLADGASKLASGSTALASGTRDAAAGVNKLATGADGIAAGNQELATRINGLADQIPPGFADDAQKLADAAPQVNKALVDANDALQKAAAECTGTPEQCQALRDAAAAAAASLDQATDTVTRIGDLAGQAAQLPAGIRAIADANQQLADGATGLAGGAREAATGLGTLAGGMDGIATGATQLADGTTKLGAGAATLSSGAAQLASGASGAEDGAGKLADGVSQVASGTSSLADGLDSAVAQLPTYTDSQATPSPTSWPIRCRRREPTTRSSASRPSPCWRWPCCGSAGSPRSWRSRPCRRAPSPVVARQPSWPCAASPPRPSSEPCRVCWWPGWCRSPRSTTGATGRCSPSCASRPASPSRPCTRPWSRCSEARVAGSPP